MAGAGVEPKLKKLQVQITQEVLPPYHASHGTPHPVVQRRFAFVFPQGTAEVDQTDYGHPGRFNPCHPRYIPTPLQARTRQLVAAAEALAALLE
jgi:hypothetical protein